MFRVTARRTANGVESVGEGLAILLGAGHLRQTRPIGPRQPFASLGGGAHPAQVLDAGLAGFAEFGRQGRQGGGHSIVEGLVEIFGPTHEGRWQQGEERFDRAISRMAETRSFETIGPRQFDHAADRGAPVRPFRIARALEFKEAHRLSQGVELRGMSFNGPVGGDGEQPRHTIFGNDLRPWRAA